MTNDGIEKAVKKYGYIIPFPVYRDICNSPQVDHIKSDGKWVDIWTNDGAHWRVSVKEK